MPRGGQFETGLTLFLADQAPELAQAHDELYPERVSEQIPLSLTLLYPFAPRDSLDASRTSEGCATSSGRANRSRSTSPGPPTPRSPWTAATTLRPFATASSAGSRGCCRPTSR